LLLISESPSVCQRLLFYFPFCLDVLVLSMSRKRARAPQPRSAPQASPEAEAAELDAELAEELGCVLFRNRPPAASPPGASHRCDPPPLSLACSGSGAGGALVLASKKAKARQRLVRRLRGGS